MPDLNALIIILFGILILVRVHSATTQRVTGWVLIIVGVILAGGIFLNIRVG